MNAKELFFVFFTCDLYSPFSGFSGFMLRTVVRELWIATVPFRFHLAMLLTFTVTYVYCHRILYVEELCVTWYKKNKNVLNYHSPFEPQTGLGKTRHYLEPLALLRYTRGYKEFPNSGHENKGQIKCHLHFEILSQELGMVSSSLCSSSASDVMDVIKSLFFSSHSEIMIAQMCFQSLKMAPLTTDLENAVIHSLWYKTLLFSRSPFSTFLYASHYVRLELTGPHSRRWKFWFCGLAAVPGVLKHSSAQLRLSIHSSVNTHMQIIPEFELDSFAVWHLISPVLILNCFENVYAYSSAVIPILQSQFPPRLPFTHLL